MINISKHVFCHQLVIHAINSEDPPRKELGLDRDKIATTVLHKMTLKEYFGLGVNTTDPLLTVAKWIAYATEVEFHFANIGDNVDL